MRPESILRRSLTTRAWGLHVVVRRQVSDDTVFDTRLWTLDTTKLETHRRLCWTSRIGQSALDVALRTLTGYLEPTEHTQHNSSDENTLSPLVVWLKHSDQSLVVSGSALDLQLPRPASRLWLPVSPRAINVQRP